MFSKKTLSNNVRAIVAPISGTKTVTVLVLFGVGSRYEQKAINGISHFIEHMMFKGTKKRPTALSISKELDGVGAEYNAYTTKENTGYWIKVNYEHLHLALDMVSDMLYNSLFSADEIEREKKVICEELRMYRDNPIMYVDTLLEQVMFEPSPLGWDIGGDDQTILGMKRVDMIEFRDTHYHGKNLVVGIAGNCEEKIGIEMIERYFGGSWERAGERNVCQRCPKHKQSAPKLLVHFKETEQVQFDMGFHAYAHGDDKSYAAALLSIILGGPMSSRLFISVRERRGLCYSIRASHQSFLDTGIFSIQAGLDGSRLEEAIKVILNELSKIAAKGVTTAELKRAKEYVKGKMAIQLEDSESVASWYVGQELLKKKVLTPEQKLEKIFEVTKDDVNAIAKDLFKTANINLALIGPYKDGNQFKKLLKIMN